MWGNEALLELLSSREGLFLLFEAAKEFTTENCLSGFLELL
jgi:hypothetical protein